MDLSFSNTNIKDFFNGSDAYIPTRELIYVHTHPLIRPNFVNELETLLLKAGDILIAKNMKGHPVEELAKVAIEIGSSLPGINEDNAGKILFSMRKAYKLCNQIIGMR